MCSLLIWLHCHTLPFGSQPNWWLIDHCSIQISNEYNWILWKGGCQWFSSQCSDIGVWQIVPSTVLRDTVNAVKAHLQHPDLMFDHIHTERILDIWGNRSFSLCVCVCVCVCTCVWMRVCVPAYLQKESSKHCLKLVLLGVTMPGGKTLNFFMACTNLFLFPVIEYCLCVVCGVCVCVCVCMGGSPCVRMVGNLE